MPTKSLNLVTYRLLAAVCCAMFVLAGCGRPAADLEDWDAVYMLGDRVGYQHTTRRHATQSGREVVQVEVSAHIVVERFGKKLVSDLQSGDTETPDGVVLDFFSETRMGPTPQRVTGRVQGDHADVQTATLGKGVSKSIPWSADYGGYAAVQDSLLRQPMQPGQRRTIRALWADAQVWQTELTARDYQRVQLPSGSEELLKIDILERPPEGQTSMKGILWTDRSGNTLKQRIDAMNTEMFRVPKEVALAEPAPARKLDFGRDTMVKLQRPLPGGHGTRQVCYRVELADGDPAKLFVSGPSQEVKSTGPHAAEVTVYAIRPGRSDGNRLAAADPPSNAARQPNNFIQSDDVKIIAQAKEAAGGETDPWKTAVDLEQYVHRVMARQDYSDAFPTAADVARTHAGDCKAHAVYLAALARARGIPARVAAGLVYIDRQAAFAYHMWTEVYIDGRWIPIDGMLGQGGIGAAHLKLVGSTLEGGASESGFVSLVQVLGQLKIEVLKAE